MPKPRSRVADYAVYLTVRIFVCIIQMLSFNLACRFARSLAWLAYQINRRHRLVAMDNLEHAFPGKYTALERDAMVRSVYRHFCTLLIAIIHLPRRFHVTNWKDYLALENGPAIVECLLSDRPLLIVTGHFGNWEMAGYSLSMLGFSSYAIARPLDNPYLDSYLRGFRERTGQRILAKHGDFELMQASEVLQRIRATTDFKFNVNLVMLDFAVRHGLLQVDDPEYLDVATGLHRPLD